ncbi:hypothetical protein NPIL_486411 [Nephila pilipes]|uniref:Uncharacterized protein n=1 Tax=Nephila pilipes TaxID=299642 RepID=A0A8X6PQ45_NEPPI|nr:hypothetical protein NPIL_486411 [Nephila pilipes]
MSRTAVFDSQFKFPGRILEIKSFLLMGIVNSDTNWLFSDSSIAVMEHLMEEAYFNLFACLKSLTVIQASDAAYSVLFESISVQSYRTVV